MNPCPCCSGKEYDACCKPFHQGALPENALLLMRSRYSAYAFNLPDYIIATTHPASPQYSENIFSWKRALTQFSRNSVFQKLDLLDFKEQGTLATVTFTAHISQNDRDATFTERSYFEKSKGRWMYRGGQLTEGHAPNLVTTGQLRLLPLAYYGDAILRRKAESIAEITDDIKKLAEEMIETMEASNGSGLAAPQIHHSIRLFVVRTPVEKEGRFDYGEPMVFINPELSNPSEETSKTSEGCLSIPTIRGDVERPVEVTIEYTTLDGENVKRRCTGWEARVVQHEYDHIEGILYIDRLDPQEKAMLAPILQKIEKRIHDGLEL